MKNIEYLNSKNAPKPLGNYSHAIAFGELIFVSGIASRDFKTNKVPGLQLDPSGNRLSYDIRLETKATLENIRTILEDSGSSLDDVLDVTTYLTSMKDFGAYNEVYSQFFSDHRPARTTVEVSGLPGDISIEIKVVARRML